MAVRSSLAPAAIQRKLLLAAANSPRMARLVSRYGMRLGAGRFVAGETLDDCARAVRAVNDRGLRANTTLLGEAVRDRATAEAVTAEYETIARRIHDDGLRAYLSIKPTHLGLSLDEGLAYENIAKLVALAGELGNFVRMDMEDSPYTDATLRMYRRLRAEGHDNTGTVLQANLRRTADDLRELLPLRPNLRLVKGAYLEPPAIAYEHKSEVDQNYIRLIETALPEGGFTAVATHDPRVVEHVADFTRARGIGNDRFEFQMLYGIRPHLQMDLAGRGYGVLVSVPFGRDWYPYLMRRLAERPANVLFFAKSLVRR
jgi:proline dehydrogenase